MDADDLQVLKGKLQETLYEMPSETAVGQPLKVEKITIYGADEVTYISDEVRGCVWDQCLTLFY